MTTDLPPFLHDLLDRRIDPLDDPAARAWLLAHPEALEPFAALQQRLARLPGPTPAPAPIRPHWPWLVAASVAAAVAVAAWLASGPSRPIDTADAALPRPEFAADGVVAWAASTSELADARTNELHLAGRTRLHTERVPCAVGSHALTVTARTVRQTVSAP